MDRDLDRAMRCARADRDALAASLAATRAALPFVGRKRPSDVPTAAGPAAASVRSVPPVLPIALAAGVAAGFLVPLSGREQRAGRAVVAPAARSMWRGAVRTVSGIVLDQALTTVARVLRGSTA